MDSTRTPATGGHARVGHSSGRLGAFLREVYSGLDRGEFFVLFQPVVHAGTGHLDGFEALVRWAHPQLGVLQPDAFVPRLEQRRHLSALTDHVLLTACTAAASWPACGGRQLRVRVNVAVDQLGDVRLVQQVADALHSSCLDPSRLLVEITEAGPLPNVDVAQLVCRRLRAAGVAIALDDFGAGSHDVPRVVLLETDEIKIDRGMVAGLPSNDHALAKVARILDLATTLRKQATVEGVETVGQLRVLLDAGAPLLQGFLFGRPCHLAGPDDVISTDRRCRTTMRLARSGPLGRQVRRALAGRALQPA